MREKLTEFHRKINEYTVIVGDFKIPLSVTDKSSKEKIREDTVELNSTINQLDLIDSIEYLIQQKKNIYFFQLIWNIHQNNHQFSSVQSLSRVRLFATP